jgi:tRNA threonylcarbamoyl adenosine modification protein (Sua5/YciO/YrdC/YwlC family)
MNATFVTNIIKVFIFALMFLEVYPSSPDQRKIEKIVSVLRSGGIIIYPTDTIYGLGCDIYNKKAIERLCQIKNVAVKKANFSFICSNLSHLSQFSKSISTPVYRVLNGHLPGPFTFILEASKEVPNVLMQNKKTVGIRVPDHPICKLLLESFGSPIISTSLPELPEIETMVDPETIYDTYGHLVDAMLSSGPGGIESSTVVDCHSGDFEIIRQGKGILSL